MKGNFHIISNVYNSILAVSLYLSLIKCALFAQGANRLPLAY